MRETLKTWFSLSRPVRQNFYAASGFGLVAFKYAVDSLLIWGRDRRRLEATRLRRSVARGARERGRCPTSIGVPDTRCLERALRIGISMTVRRSMLETERGKSRLISPAANRTRLEDSTWHRNNLFPQLYWNLWSDTLIHRTHRRVLDHVKRGSEGTALASP